MVVGMVLVWQSVDTAEDINEVRFEGDPAELVDALAELLELARRPAWHRYAACRGQGVAAWFPARGQSLDAARAVCAGCSVREECLAAALEVPAHDDNGVWGGTSVRERLRLRRQSPSGMPDTAA
jgi:WhiB family redox-sensing transcriptional regulator